MNKSIGVECVNTLNESIQNLMENVRKTMSCYAERAVELAEANVFAAVYGHFVDEKSRTEKVKAVRELRDEEWAKAMKKAKNDPKLAIKYYCA